MKLNGTEGFSHGCSSGLSFQSLCFQWLLIHPTTGTWVRTSLSLIWTWISRFLGCVWTRVKDFWMFKILCTLVQDLALTLRLACSIACSVWEPQFPFLVSYRAGREAAHHPSWLVFRPTDAWPSSTQPEKAWRRRPFASPGSLLIPMKTILNLLK